MKKCPLSLAEIIVMISLVKKMKDLFAENAEYEACAKCRDLVEELKVVEIKLKIEAGP